MADATLTAQLVLDTRNFYNSLRSAESDASKFTSRIETSVSKTSNTFTNLGKSMQQGFKDTSTAATTFNTTLGKTERGFTSLSNKFQSVNKNISTGFKDTVLTAGMFGTTLRKTEDELPRLANTVANASKSMSGGLKEGAVNAAILASSFTKVGVAGEAAMVKTAVAAKETSASLSMVDKLLIAFGAISGVKTVSSEGEDFVKRRAAMKLQAEMLNKQGILTFDLPSDATSKATQSASSLASGWQKLIEKGTSLGGVVGSVVKFLGSIPGPTMVAAAAIAFLALSWDQAKKGFEASRIDTMFKNSAEAVGKDAEQLAKRLDKAFGGAVEETEIKFAALRGNLINMSDDAMVNFAEASKTAAKLSGQNAAEIFRGFIEGSMSMRVRALVQLKTFNQDELTILQESVKNHKLTQEELSRIVKARTSEWEKALNAPEKSFKKLTKSFSEFWENVFQKPLGDLFTPVASVLSDILRLVTPVFGGLFQGLSKLFSYPFKKLAEVFTSITEKILEMGNALKEWLGGVWEDFVTKLEDMYYKVKGWIFGEQVREGAPKGDPQSHEEVPESTLLIREKWQENYDTQMKVESVSIRINKLQGQQKLALEAINSLIERGYDKYVGQEERLKIQWFYEEQILKAKIEQAQEEAKKVPEAEAGAKATADAKVAIAKQELETARKKYMQDKEIAKFDSTFVKTAKEKYEQAAGILKVEKERIEMLNTFNEEQLQNQITLGLKDELDLVKQKFQYEIDSLQVQEKQIQNQLDNTPLREQRIELEAQIKLLEEKGIKLFSQMKDNTAMATRNAKLALGGYAALNQQLIEIENARKRDLDLFMKKYPQYVKDIEMRAQEQRESALSSYYELVIKYNRNIQDMWNNTGRLMVLQTRNIWQTTSQLIQDTFSNLRSTIQDALFGWMVNEGDDLKGYINKFARSMAASLSASIAEDLDTMLKEFVFGKKVDMAIKAQNVYVNGMPIGGYQGEEKKGLADKLKEMFGLDTSTGENEIPPQDTVLDKVANSIEDTWTEIIDWWDSLDVTADLQGVELSINNAFSIVSSMLTAMVEKIVSDQGGFGSMFSGFGGGFDLFEMFGGGSGMFFHQGGVVGSTNVPRKRVNPLLFMGAPRLHSGLMPGEYPAVLQQGETVVPRGGFAGQQTVVYNIYANDSKSFSESMRENRAIIHKEVVNGLRDNKTRHDMNRFLGRR